MVRYVIVSIAGGVLFGILDGLINANPLAQRRHDVYRPIARPSVDFLAGIAIDLVYGFVIAGVYLLLYQCLPGRAGPVKGISFAFFIWFFRVVMGVASTWVMFDVPAGTLLYTLVT